jgi:hypothetical protein
MRRTAKETQQIIKRMTFLRRLLKENGLMLSGYDPGVTAYKKIGKDFDGRDRCVSMNFERAEWAWLEPLLVELRSLRRRVRKDSTTKNL